MNEGTRRVLEQTAARKAAGLIPKRYPVESRTPRRKRCAEPPQATPCVHRGELLTGVERERLGLSHQRVWLQCLHPAAPLGQVVCPCQGCGPKCSGYTLPVVENPIS